MASRTRLVVRCSPWGRQWMGAEAHVCDGHIPRPAVFLGNEDPLCPGKIILGELQPLQTKWWQWMLNVSLKLHCNMPFICRQIILSTSSAPAVPDAFSLPGVHFQKFKTQYCLAFPWGTAALPTLQLPCFLMGPSCSKLTGAANISEAGEIIKRDLKSSEIHAGSKMRFKLEKYKLIYLEEIIN